MSETKLDWTKPIQTRDGRKARLVATLNKFELPQLVVVTDYDGQEFNYAVATSGKYIPDGMGDGLDIINTPPEPIKRSAWFNVHPNGKLVGPFESKEDAKKWALRTALDTIELHWTEPAQ